MNQFINTRDTIVTDAIDGVVLASGGTLTRLDGYPHIKVVVRQDVDKSKVALVSGGGSGHEPAHAGFVGRGLLTAAVCGDIFASPSVDAVLAGILAVTGSAGCLLIVKNYTGDRLNFGLAAERARTLGLQVNMVVVDDDIALPDLPQARGVAGTLLVHKIAGSAAEHGADLSTVTNAATSVIERVKTIGMSLDTCTIPGMPKEHRVKEGMAELGLGIHGEAGIEQVRYTTAKAAMAEVVDKLAQEMITGPHVALLNNLGGATPLEMSILTRELLTSSISSQLAFLTGPAPLMTSLDMRGFSLSVLPVTDDQIDALLTEVEPFAWPGLSEIKKAGLLALPDGLAPIKPVPSSHPERKSFIEKCCNILIAAEGDLNALDAKSGDGDTGSTLKTAAAALKASGTCQPVLDT